MSDKMPTFKVDPSTLDSTKVNKFNGHVQILGDIPSGTKIKASGNVIVKKPDIVELVEDKRSHQKNEHTKEYGQYCEIGMDCDISSNGMVVATGVGKLTKISALDGIKLNSTADDVELQTKEGQIVIWEIIGDRNKLFAQHYINIGDTGKNKSRAVTGKDCHLTANDYLLIEGDVGKNSKIISKDSFITINGSIAEETCVEAKKSCITIKGSIGKDAHCIAKVINHNADKLHSSAKIENSSTLGDRIEGWLATAYKKGKNKGQAL